ANAGRAEIAYAVVDFTSSLEEVYVGIVAHPAPLQLAEPIREGMRHRNAGCGVIGRRIVEQRVFGIAQTRKCDPIDGVYLAGRRLIPATAGAGLDMEAAKPRLAGAVEVDHILRIEMGHLFEYTIEERRRPAKTSGGLVHLRRIIDSNAQAVNDVLSLDTCESLLFAAWRESIDQRKCVTNAESFCGHRVYSTKT